MVVSSEVSPENLNLPAEWIAPNEQVARFRVIINTRRVELNECNYLDSSTGMQFRIRRVQNYATVRVIDLEANQEINSFQLTGTSPEPCPETARGDGTREGGAINYSDLVPQLTNILTWTSALQLETTIDSYSPFVPVNSLGYVDSTTIYFVAASQVELFDAGSGEILDVFTVEGSNFYFDQALAIGQTGRGPWTVWIKDIASGETVFSTEISGEVVWGLYLSPDGHTLAVHYSGYDGPRLLRLWNVQTGTDFSLEGVLDFWGFSPDGQSIILTEQQDEEVVRRIRSVIDGEELLVVPSEFIDATFSPDGSQLLTLESDQLLIRDAQTGEVVQTLVDLCTSYADFLFSPDGRYVAYVQNDCDDWAHGRVYELHIAKVGIGEIVSFPHSTRFFYFAYSPDGNSVATLTMDGTLRVWDLTWLDAN